MEHQEEHTHLTQVDGLQHRQRQAARCYPAFERLPQLQARVHGISTVSSNFKHSAL